MILWISLCCLTISWSATSCTAFICKNQEFFVLISSQTHCGSTFCCLKFSPCQRKGSRLTTYWGVKYLITLAVQPFLWFKKGKLPFLVVSAVLSQSTPRTNPVDSLALQALPLGSDAPREPESCQLRLHRDLFLIRRTCVWTMIIKQRCFSFSSLSSLLLPVLRNKSAAVI